MTTDTGTHRRHPLPHTHFLETTRTRTWVLTHTHVYRRTRTSTYPLGPVSCSWGLPLVRTRPPPLPYILHWELTGKLTGIVGTNQGRGSPYRLFPSWSRGKLPRSGVYSRTTCSQVQDRVRPTPKDPGRRVQPRSSIRQDVGGPTFPGSGEFVVTHGSAGDVQGRERVGVTRSVILSSSCPSPRFERRTYLSGEESEGVDPPTVDLPPLHNSRLDTLHGRPVLQSKGREGIHPTLLLQGPSLSLGRVGSSTPAEESV